MTAAQRCQHFTVEGDPSDVIAVAQAAGWKITRPRWWQRTYAIPRWIVWLVVVRAIIGLPLAVHTMIGWF